LAKEKKPLSEGELVKTCAIEMANAFGDEKMAKHFETVSLSHKEVDAAYGDLQLHTDIRWMSRGKCLERFYALRLEIPVFLENSLTADTSADNLASDPPNLTHFPACGELRNDITELAECEMTIHRNREALKMLQDQFNNRFQDFHDMRGTIRLFTDPISAV
ncbi:hypothetical protein JOQ06_008291, partial [Pogonophryne albipinna]